MKNSGYNEHMAKCPSYELLSHWTPLQKCVNTWTVRIKPRFNVPQISKLECFFLFEKWLELKYTYTQIYTIWSLWEDWHPQTKDAFCNTALEVVMHLAGQDSAPKIHKSWNVRCFKWLTETRTDTFFNTALEVVT